MYRILFLFMVIITLCYAQPERPMLSQKSVITQRIGLTDLTITYHRPGVKGREIWGKLVPFNQVWRAGANEATTLEVSDNVIIEGKSLEKGIYAFFVVPYQEKVKIILNSEWNQWGAFWMDSTKNVLEIVTNWKNCEFEEWLCYNFTDLCIYSASLKFRWEKQSFSLKIEVPTDSLMDNMNRTVLYNAMVQLHGMARTYLETGTHWEEALDAVQKSIEIEENFDNLKTKAELLAVKEYWEEAVETGERAIHIAGSNLPSWYVRQFAETIINWKNKTK